MSVYNTPAWEWNDERKQFYLHQFNVTQPDLNYRNSAVVDFMSVSLYLSSVYKIWYFSSGQLMKEKFLSYHFSISGRIEILVKFGCPRFLLEQYRVLVGRQQV